MTTTIWLIYFICLALCITSLLKCVIVRKIRDIDLRLPNFCAGCMRHLKFYETLPILSFIILKGKCKSCKEKIPLI
jgi:prepilin signal peptidase PulO-like enzyme (type II secretory pathway)